MYCYYNTSCAQKLYGFIFCTYSFGTQSLPLHTCVLRSADTYLTKAEASCIHSCQLTEELLNSLLLLYWLFQLSMHTVSYNVIQLIYSCKDHGGSPGTIIAQIYQSCQINVYNSEWALVSWVQYRSNLELLWVSHWCANTVKKPLFGGPIVQGTQAVQAAEASAINLGATSWVEGWEMLA